MPGTKANEQDQHQNREQKPIRGNPEHRSDLKKERKDENRTGFEGRHGQNKAATEA